METVVEFFLLNVTLSLLIFTTSTEKANPPLWGLSYLLFQLVFFIDGTSGYLFKFIKSWVADSVFQSALHHIYEYALAKLSNYKLKKKIQLALFTPCPVSQECNIDTTIFS